MDKLVSVIVPIYNSKEYLPRCVESIQQQSYKNIEIILVDDGSTDGSGLICDMFAEKDNRIKVIHKSNGGVTSSRKEGLNIAKGDYIGFVDSDDWIEEKMYEVMLSAILKSQSDVVCFSHIKEYQGGQYVCNEIINEGIYEVNDYILDNMVLYQDSLEPGISHNVWNKLFQREIIYNTYMQVPNSVIFYEDAVVIWASILSAQRIMISNQAYYHYYVNPLSATQGSSDKYFLAINEAYNYTRKILTQYKHSEIVEYKLDKKMIQALVMGMTGRFQFYKPEKLIPRYVVSLEELDKESKVVLYGAGNVGKSIYRQLKNKGITPVLWVDVNYNSNHLPVSAVEEINSVRYDYVLVAVLHCEIAKEIEKKLITMGVPSKKIIWKQPKELVELLYNG